MAKRRLKKSKSKLSTLVTGKKRGRPPKVLINDEEVVREIEIVDSFEDSLFDGPEEIDFSEDTIGKRLSDSGESDED